MVRSAPRTAPKRLGIAIQLLAFEVSRWKTTPKEKLCQLDPSAESCPDQPQESSTNW